MVWSNCFKKDNITYSKKISIFFSKIWIENQAKRNRLILRVTLKWQIFKYCEKKPQIFQHIKYCEAAYNTCMNNTANWKTANQKIKRS